MVEVVAGSQGDYEAWSVLFDPATDKAYLGTQEYENVKKFLEGRQPEWYTSIVQPFAGMGTVLDLGCGPGLTMKALHLHGVQHTIGIERSQGFAKDGQAEGLDIIEHDLSHPVPFLPCSSIDGALAHFSLDYSSPIGMRSTFRNVRRVLTPGGKFIAWLCAIGQESGDWGRTVAYTPDLLRAMMEEAGFTGIETELLSKGRNIRVQGQAPSSYASQPLPRRDAVEGEAWITGRLAAGSADLALTLQGDAGQTRLAISDDGKVVLDETVLVNSGEKAPISFSLAVARPHAHPVELNIIVWRNRDRILDHQVALNYEPRELLADTASPADRAKLEFLDIWCPPVMAYEGDNVVQTLEDMDATALKAAIEMPRKGICRTVVSAPAAHFLDETVLTPLSKPPGRFYPLARVTQEDTASPALASKLTSLWQKLVLFGLAWKGNVRTLPRDLAAWANSHSAMLLLESVGEGDIEAAKDLAARYPHATILAVLANEAPRKRSLWATLVGGDRKPSSLSQLVTILQETRNFFAVPATAEDAAPLVRQCPTKVVMAPGVQIDGLDSASSILVQSENLRFIIERVICRRTALLRGKKSA